MSTSTIRVPNRRRRSHSASSALSSTSSSPHIAKKAAVKRAYPQASCSQLGEASRWDADAYRPGKRRRRGLSAGSDESRISKSGGFAQVASTPSTVFAISFGLPVSKVKTRERGRRSPTLPSSSLPMDVSDNTQNHDLRRLRSTAFSELERSVEESGEGLVRRMKELECLRSDFLSAPGDRGRTLLPHESPGANSYPQHSDVSEDDDDDIQIYAGEPSASFAIHAPDDVAMGSDCQYDNPTLPSPHSSSPHSLGDGFTSESADESSPHFFSSPSSSSPPTSPLPESVPSLPPSAPSGPTIYGSHAVQLPSDTPDKVIEALTLALANGAGGLNDYAALRQGDVVDDVNAYHHAGELWR